MNDKVIRYSYYFSKIDTALLLRTHSSKTYLSKDAGKLCFNGENGLFLEKLVN